MAIDAISLPCGTVGNGSERPDAGPSPIEVSMPSRVRVASHEGVPDDLHLDLEPSGPWPVDRPWVALQMVASLDGAIAVDGRSSGLGGAADRRSFLRLRARADVVLAGAGTARDEDYGPPGEPDTAAAEARRTRGQAPRPVLALVTRSGRLDPDSRLFADGHRPIVVTTSTTDLGAAADRVDARRHGVDDVDLAGALRDLHADGVRWVTCEGGPSLNAAMVAAGLVDEVFVTVAPRLVGAHDATLVDGPLAGGRRPRPRGGRRRR